MSITIESTTDSAEHVASLMAPAQASEEATPSETASTIETPSETAGDSETTEDTTQDQDSEDESSEDKPAKSKGGFQRRIDKLTRTSAEQRQQIADLERRLAAQNAAATQPEATQQAPAGRPMLNEFDTYEQYVEALTDWKVTERENKQREAAQRAAAEAERATKQSTFQERISEARGKYADFDEALADAAEVPITAAMNEAMLESELAGDLAYYLAKNPKEAARIAKLSPVSAVREMGKLETQLSAKPDPAKEQPRRQTSKAPEPVQPVSTSKTLVEKRVEDMDFEEYKRFRLSQQLKRNR